MTDTRNLLYLTPVAPARAGNGLAMRSGAILRALAEAWRVHLLVVPHYPCPLPMTSEELRSLCAATATVPPEVSGLGFGAWVQQAAAVFAGVRFEIVHHVRLATLPFGAPYLATEPTTRAHLDLDDVESVARRRLGELYRLNGRDAEARLEDAEAARVETLEQAALRHFERVYVCSSLDRARLLEGTGAEVRVLPNIVEIPIPASLPSAGYGEGWLVTPARPFRLLFVGTLGYFPNEDAVLYFCSQILPLLRTRSRRPVELDVLGTGPTAALLALAGAPDVRVIGFAPDLAPWYQEADAVIVPLRAGGGTRIKLLEAFAQMRPVVSTSLGLEGIDAADGQHLLIADTPDAFAAACLRLMREPGLGRHLTANAAELLRRRHGAEALSRALA